MTAHCILLSLRLLTEHGGGLVELRLVPGNNPNREPVFRSFVAEEFLVGHQRIRLCDAGRTQVAIVPRLPPSSHAVLCLGSELQPVSKVSGPGLTHVRCTGFYLAGSSTDVISRSVEKVTEIQSMALKASNIGSVFFGSTAC